MYNFLRLAEWLAHSETNSANVKIGLFAVTSDGVEQAQNLAEINKSILFIT